MNKINFEMLSLYEKLSTAVLKYYPKTFVFCYHRIIPKPVAKQQMVHRALYLTPETFEKHIIWMKKNGQIISINDILSPEKKNRFMITFDDGWKDNFGYAFPILKKYNVPATIFISTNNIDKGILFWTEELCVRIGDAIAKYSLEKVKLILLNLFFEIEICNTNTKKILTHKNRNIYVILDQIIEYLKLVSVFVRDKFLNSLYSELNILYKIDGHKYLLNWSEVIEMSRESIAFGSHTHTHTLLNKEEDAIIDFELVESKKILEKKLGVEINSFAYPNGYFQNKYIQVSLSNNGYKYAFTLDRQPVNDQNIFLLPRYLLYEGNSRSIGLNMMKALAKAMLRKVVF